MAKSTVTPRKRPVVATPTKKPRASRAKVARNGRIEETLNNTRCDTLAIGERIGDAGHPGLFIIRKPSGVKCWIYRYKFNGEQRKPTLGHYPAMGIKEARNVWRDIEAAKDRGVDPEHRHAKPVGTLAAFLEVYLDSQRVAGNTEKTLVKKRQALTAYVINAPDGLAIGAKPLNLITADDVRPCLLALQSRGVLDMARRTADYVRALFEKAKDLGVLDESFVNPAVRASNALESRQKKPMDALPFGLMPPFLRALRAYREVGGSLQVQCALRLLIYTGVRSVDVRKLKWRNVHLDGPHAQYSIELGDAKMRRPDFVPLASQVADMLRAYLEQVVSSEYAFPSYYSAREGQPMSDVTLIKAIRVLGIPPGVGVVHGFRSILVTYMQNRGVPKEVLKAVLSQKGEDKTFNPYARGKHSAARRVVLQCWADTLDAIEAAGTTEGVRVPMPSLIDLEHEEPLWHLADVRTGSALWQNKAPCTPKVSR